MSGSFVLHESPLDPTAAAHQTVVGAGLPWLGRVRRGEVLRIVDLNGNQAVDTLLFDADDPHDRYSPQRTIREQGKLYLTTGTVLVTESGASLATIVADTCGRHDTLGGACSAESNTVRYGHHTRFMHNCRDSFLLAAARASIPLDKRDLGANINFFMNVPVTPAGGLTFEDGVSAGGKYVELRAERDALVLISNCPQLNNPCNGYDPTPVQLLRWSAPT